MTTRCLQSVLVVDDDAHIRCTLVQYLSSWADEVRECECLAVASHLVLAAEWHPELLVLDSRLPDGHARDLLRKVAARPPAPSTIVMGSLDQTAECFDLARLGVCAYLDKPLTVEKLDRAMSVAVSARDPTPYILNALGSLSLTELEDYVRRTMVECGHGAWWQCACGRAPATGVAAVSAARPSQTARRVKHSVGGKNICPDATGLVMSILG